ncbi:MAG: hypothetical protein K8H99_04290, partial [Nitrospirae bacterium]|nr:hypothetical protein [Fimbriimonadaceae bacterium]
MRLKSLAPLSLVALATFACGPKAPISAAHSVLGTQAEPWRAVVFQSNAVTIIGQGKPQTSAISNDEGSLTDAWWRWFVRFDQPDNLFVGREDRYLMINVKNGTVQTIEGPSDGQYTFRNPPDDLSYYDNPILFPRFDLDIVTTTLPSVRTLDQSLKWQPRYGSSDGSLILWEAFVRDDRADPGVLEYGLRRYAVTILNAANPMPEVIDLGTRRDYRQFPWCIERAGKNHIILQFPAYEGETPSLYEIKLGATGEWIFQQVRYEGRL